MFLISFIWIIFFIFCYWENGLGMRPSWSTPELKTCALELRAAVKIQGKLILELRAKRYPSISVRSFSLHSELATSTPRPCLHSTLKTMWNTFSVCLSHSAENATEALSLVLHSVSHRLKSMWNTAVSIKNCKQLFSRRLAFTIEKKQNPQRRWCPYYVLLFFRS